MKAERRRWGWGKFGKKGGRERGHIQGGSEREMKEERGKRKDFITDPGCEIMVRKF